jgi:hypothetical protein
MHGIDALLKFGLAGGSALKNQAQMFERQRVGNDTAIVARIPRGRWRIASERDALCFVDGNDHSARG